MSGAEFKDREGGAAGEGWMDRHLPPRGFERTAFLVIAGLALGLKILALYHYRIDSDETQHAHVVWGWVTGQLQYRDVFDNHMPLFQMLCTPLMAALGERADIMIWLRWAMLPLTIASVCCLYQLTEALYSRRAAPWFALCGAVLWKFFYTSTEFRPDQLWTLFWLLALVTAVKGEFTVKRAFGAGLLLGLAGAVSVKITPLVAALATAAAIAMGFAWRRRMRPGLLEYVSRLGAVGIGAVIAPAAVALYFASRGAFGEMRYCVLTHNMVPGLKRWAHLTEYQWYFPVSVIVLGAYGWLIFRQTPDTRLAIRRTAVLLTPWLYLALLLSYWPDITREDDLPYVPLTPLSAMPLLIAAGALVRGEKQRRLIWTYGAPAAMLCNLAVTCAAHNLRSDQVRVTAHDIADALELTKPKDYVMDDKGEYVYRRRAYYWAIEPITNTRIRLGYIHDSIPMRMTEKGVKLCCLICARPGSIAQKFIIDNYLPIDPQTRALAVLGKVIIRQPAEGTCAFQVIIPQEYAVISETGRLEGELDGKPYRGPVWLAAGAHEFRRTSGGGRVAILLEDAYSKGFLPLYKTADEIAKDYGTPTDNRPAELQ
jgi:hypothetical protein